MYGLEAAILQERPKNGLIIHTDQGAQYTSHRFYECSRNYHFIHSQSQKGDPYDNAVMESFYKIQPQNTPGQTKTQAKLDIINYLEIYYNYKRTPTSLNYLRSYEFEVSNEFSYRCPFFY
ncbi:DDE-type integrase/transposase/recombinase [Listeria booriae]|uniref:DDE-type integrase/transposase/recombinase n=1 Tax=Listeria booriae TaxID=1552123 RepID=A0A842AJG3_9LIST|nr:DDE-type integrase/transposase/recombinase [Listeria booriae]